MIRVLSGRHRFTGRRRSAVGVGVLAISLALGGACLAQVGATAAAAPVVTAQPGPTKPGNSRLIATTAVLQPGLQAGGGRRTVFVQLSGPGGADVSARVLAAAGDAESARRAVALQRAGFAATAARVAATAVGADPAAQVIFRVSNAIPGVGLIADAAAVGALARRPDVVKISEIVPKVAADAGAAELTKALQTWTDTGTTGRGVRIGVIDTGIDYTHADFGGPGTVATSTLARQSATAPWTPTAKVVGGYDFVGDDYDAAAGGPSGAVNAAYQPVPHPDSNPYDCNGHGTHVAGTIAGTGVGADGLTFTGNYAALDGAALYGMDIAPGMAPQASLYAFKVFGCQGATDQVIPALDRALDPNGDGDFSDRLDIVNLSLSSAGAATDDPETAVLDTLAAHGVLPVIAAGNGGDSTDSASSLTGSVRSIAVASSVDAYQRLDGLSAAMPGQPATRYAGQASVTFGWSSSRDVTGTVVSIPGGNSDGCSPLSPGDTARVAGHVAWLDWDDDDATRECGSAVRAGNLLAAGAVGVLLTSGTPVFTAGITGSAGLPMMQLTPSSTAALAADVDNGLVVTFSGSLIGQQTVIDDSITDLLGTFSARGPHTSLVKPDVAAPGDTIVSARAGSGSGSSLRSGTSMASADVAGIAALVGSRHPGWTPEQVKAAVMNTAGHDLFSEPGRTGATYGPARAGSGRVDAMAAVQTQVLAYSSTTPGAVSASFGVVPVSISQISTVATSAVVVQNTGPAAVDVTLTYQGVVTQSGVQYDVSPATMSLTPGATALATVTMTITPSALRHTLDPTMAAQQSNVLTGLDEARQYVTSSSGRVVISPSGGAAVRVPVSGSAKPTSQTGAADGRVGGVPAVVLTGQGLQLASATDPETTTYTSLVSVLDLGYLSDRIAPCAGVPPPPASAGVATGSNTARGEPCALGASPPAGDLQAVGAGRSGPANGAAQDYLWFGMSTYGDLPTVGKTIFPTVNIDTDGDNTADYTVQVQALGGSDLLYALLFDDRGAGSLIGIHPVNYNLGNVDTNVFDNNVLLIPIDPVAIGFRSTDSTFPIRYSVATVTAYGAPMTGGTIDTTPAIGFDVARPAISTAAPLWQDQGGTGIPYRLAPGVGAADALVLHLHGDDGSRVQVFSLSGG